MLNAERQVDVTTNNLANVNTAGFKKDLLAAMAAPNIATVREPFYPLIPADRNRGFIPIGVQSTGVMAAEVWTDFESGPLVQTGRTLDIAIVDDGFFTVQDAAGNTYYTRNGSFTVGVDGNLVTQEGLTVLGDGGAISIGNAGRIEISRSGAVIADGEILDSLRIAHFTDPHSLRKVGHTLFTGPNPDGIGTANVESGAIEQSNASVIESMVKLIEGHRLYEADSRVLQTLDATLDRAANDLGSLR